MLLIDTRDARAGPAGLGARLGACGGVARLAAAFGIAAFFTAGALSYLAMLLTIYFALRARSSGACPTRRGLTEYRQ